MPTNKYQTLKSYGNRLLRAGAVLAATGLVALTTGCGTINSSRYQTIKIESEPSNAEIWVMEGDTRISKGCTPSEIFASRKDADAIILKKDGYCSAHFAIKRSFNPQSFKNFFLLPFFFMGGLIDLVEGGAYNLQPESINAHLIKKLEEIPITTSAPKQKETPAKSDEDIVKYLKMLKDLRDSNTITEEEFNQKRKSLVDKL